LALLDLVHATAAKGGAPPLRRIAPSPGGTPPRVRADLMVDIATLQRHRDFWEQVAVHGDVAIRMIL
jgi:hypothetical protein